MNSKYTGQQVENLLDSVSGKTIYTAGNGISISGGTISVSGGTGGNNVVELTQEQYDNLDPKDPTAFYIITDAQGINPSDYYTSAQTNNAIHEATSAITIDLSDYYNSAQTNSAIDTASGATIDWVKGQNYLTEHQSLADYYTSAQTNSALTVIENEIAGKQATLVSGTNIKTVNNQSILGEGNINIQAGNDVVELTQAQYDALTGKSSTTLYIITDAQGLNPENYYTSAQTDAILDDYVNSAQTVNSAITANSATVAGSVPSGVTGYDQAYIIRVMTSNQYSGITPDNNTIYIIKD